MIHASVPTETMDIADAERQFGQIVERVSQTRRPVVVEEDGSTVAAVISPDDLDRLNWLNSERERDLAVFDEIGAAFVDATPEEIEREAAEAVANVRNKQKTTSAT